ncbi:MAG: nucleotide exchange factor GrpE [Candidatus Yonathbacteria bacterium]|nr:nucleotide exchange factor GrpE [Candidatus Yonathbacteria bacterium]
MSTYFDDTDIHDIPKTGALADGDRSGDSGESDDVAVFYEEDQGPAGVKRLRERLAQAVKEKQEYLDGWQRAKADFMNYKKDQDALHGKIKEAGKESMIHDLLSVADSFEMAFANKESWEKVDENWRRGVEYIYAQFGKVLDDHGITVIDPGGERFDPVHHSAAEAVPTDDLAKDDIVITVVQKGYIMNGKVLRPARVRVGQYVAP